MNSVACNYASVRFLPYRETGEFVNVGVVIYCPEIDYFDFQMESNKTKRITDFFPQLNIEILKAALQSLARDLETHRTRHPLQVFSVPRSTSAIEQDLIWFRELVRPRESLLHFGEAGTILVSKPDEACPLIFERMVERQFTAV
jgi:hypothetical protein